MKFTKTLMLVPVVGMALAVGLGAAQSQAQRAAPGEKGPTAGAQKAQKTGIPECDKYFAMVDACIAGNKMSAEEKKAAQFNVDRLRMMLPIAKAPQGRATLAERCTKSIELGQKDDKHGCYKSTDKPGRSR